MKLEGKLAFVGLFIAAGYIGTVLGNVISHTRRINEAMSIANTESYSFVLRREAGNYANNLDKILHSIDILNPFQNKPHQPPYTPVYQLTGN